MTTVYLGNRDAFNHTGQPARAPGELDLADDASESDLIVALDQAGVPHADGRGIEKAKGKRRLEVVAPDEKSPIHVLADITHPTAGAWALNTLSGRDKNTETKPPAWVSSDNQGLAEILGAHYGCEVREFLPRGERGEFASFIAGTATLMATLAVLALRMSPHLRTNAGTDVQAKQMAGPASATAVAKWIALTANSTAPGATDTTLTGEITTASGGLVRVAATYAHTGGTNTYTLTNTFTANGSDSLPVVVAKIGVFDASSSGNLVFETLLSATATLNAVGDAMAATQTVTL